MKKREIYAMALLLMATGAGMSSCSVNDNEKTPEEVEDPIKDVVEYYIVGQVMENNQGLAGASVTVEGAEAVTTDASGQFKVAVSDKKEYTITVQKDGYLGAESSVTVPSGANNRDSYAISLNLTKKSAAVTLNKENDATIVADGAIVDAVAEIEEAGVVVPHDAITEDNTDVTVTSYVPEQTSATVSQIKDGTSFMNVYVETSKDVNGKNAIIAVNNPTNSNTNFVDVTVYKKAAGSRADAQGYEKLGAATYDEATKSYQYQLLEDGSLSGDYSFRITPTRQESGSGTEAVANAEGKVDNSGNFAALTDVQISYEAPMGWSYTTTPESVMGSDKNLAALIDNAVTATEGASGVYKISYSAKTNVSGNSIMYWNVKSSYTNVNYTFKMNNGDKTVKLKKYTGAIFNYRNETASQHSGGTSTASI